jgi:hypothetical protein
MLRHGNSKNLCSGQQRSKAYIVFFMHNRRIVAALMPTLQFHCIFLNAKLHPTAGSWQPPNRRIAKALILIRIAESRGAAPRFGAIRTTLTLLNNARRSLRAKVPDR